MDKTIHFIRTIQFVCFWLFPLFFSSYFLLFHFFLPPNSSSNFFVCVLVFMSVKKAYPPVLSPSCTPFPLSDTPGFLFCALFTQKKPRGAERLSVSCFPPRRYPCGSSTTSPLLSDIHHHFLVRAPARSLPCPFPHVPLS